MTVADRSRRDLIISAARDLAEAKGWEAVTTRRLAELVEYTCLLVNQRCHMTNLL